MNIDRKILQLKSLLKFTNKEVETKADTADVDAAIDDIDLSSKQNVLVSGINIKTVNSNSILGAGNLVVDSGSFSGDMDDIPDGATYVKTHNDYTDSDQSKVASALQSETSHADVLVDGDIGSIVQGYDANIVSDASYVHTDNNYTDAEQTLLASLEPTSVHPSTLTVTSGTLDTGVVGDLAALGGTDVNISEATGGSALRADLTFTGVTKMDAISIYGRYTGGAGHHIDVSIKQAASATYDIIGVIGSTTGKQWYAFNIFNESFYNDSGTVIIRLNHPDNGINTHDLVLDFVDLVSGGGGSGSTVLNASAVTFIPAGNLASENVQEAIEELDTEKAAVGQQFYIGTTQVAINRASAALTLAGLTLTTPNIGTPTAGVLTSCTGLPDAGLANGKFCGGHIFGLGMSNAADTVNDITVAVGEARSEDNTADIILASAITKRLDAAWSVGTNAGGINTGAVAASTWYEVILIKRPDTGVVDVMFSTTANRLTFPDAAYTKYRRIGWIRTDAGAAGIKQFSQRDDDFTWITQVNDVATTKATAAAAVTLTVPPYCIARFRATADMSTSVNANSMIVFSEVIEGNVTPALSTGIGSLGYWDLATGASAGHFELRVSSTSQIEHDSDVQVGNFDISTFGYRDSRCRLSNY